MVPAIVVRLSTKDRPDKLVRRWPTFVAGLLMLRGVGYYWLCVLHMSYFLGEQGSRFTIDEAPGMARRRALLPRVDLSG